MADRRVPEHVADSAAAEPADDLVHPGRVSTGDQREDPVESVTELDVVLGVHQVEEPHRFLEVLLEPGGRAGHRPQVEDDGVVIPAVEGFVGFLGVLPEDEAEGHVVDPEGRAAVLP